MRTLMLGVAAVLTLTLPGQPSAQTAGPPTLTLKCGEYSEITGPLRKALGQVLVWERLGSPKLLLQGYGSKNGTWTLLGVMPEGGACLIGAGYGFVMPAATDPT